MLSCTGSLSKNLKAGRLFAQGKTMHELSIEFDALPEGLNTIHSVHQLIKKHNLSLPLCQATYAIIAEGASVETLLR